MQEIQEQAITQYISDYINYLEMERGLSKNTILAYESDLIALFDFLGNKNLDEIKRKDFSFYTKHLAKENIK